MATNSSATYTDEIKWEIVRHILYTIEGTCIVIFNALIVLTICRQAALRSMKEYTMLGSLAFADSICGLGTLFAGVYRLRLWLTGRHLEPASGRYCLLTGHNLFWLFQPASHSMLIPVSLDRLLSVLTPLKYATLTNTYMFCMSGLAYGAALVLAVVIFAMNWPNVEPVHNIICWTSHAYGINGSYMRDIMNSASALISVCMYLCMPILYRNKLAPTNGDAARKRREKFQKRLNKTVTISCSFTFVLICVPWLTNVWRLNISEDRDQYEWIAVWMFIVSNINPMLNLFIYYRKQIYFKIAFKALFKNKTLPLSLDNWQRKRK